MQYVLEVLRAEGTSEWRTASHDEFALVMDGTVIVDLVKLDNPIRPDGEPGSVAVGGEPTGKKMGRITAGRGHMALLPAQRRVPVHERATRRDLAADDRRSRHRRAVGRDLLVVSDCVECETETHHDDDRQEPFEAGPPNAHGYESFTIGGFTFSARRVLRSSSRGRRAAT